MRERGFTRRAVPALVGLFVLIAGIVLWLDPFGATGPTVHVRVVDPETGRPVRGVMVRGRHDESWVGVSSGGEARLDDVTLPPGQRVSAETLARLIEVDGRYAAAADLPTARARADGSWEVEVPVESFGLLTVALQATLLPNVRAYVDGDRQTGVRAVAVDGRGVARLGEPASYRISGGRRRIPVVLKGDMGVAMARWLVLAPGPGAHLKRTYAAIAATPVAGRVVRGAGASPPTLGGRLMIEPHDWETLAAGDALEVLGPLDPVVVNPDGTFLAPHLSPGRYDLSLQLDFLGRIPLDQPTEVRRANPDLRLDVDVTTSWLRIRIPEEARADRKSAEYAIERDPPTERAAWIVNHADASYVVLPEPGHWHITATLPGTNQRPPLITEMRVDADAVGPLETEGTFVEAPHGTVDVVVPDAVRTAMRGATVELDSGRSWSLLADLTRKITLKHVRAGVRTVVVTWRDKAFEPHVARVDVPAGGTAIVTVQRQAKAP